MSKKGDKAKEYLENWQRSQAELENLKKRSTKERQEYLQFATRELILDLLPILDNFERAIEHAPSDGNWITGITYIHQQLLETLKNHGVEKREVKIGDEFDAKVHHAVSREEGAKEAAVKENHILKVITQAYVMGGEVIRPANVIVAGDSESKTAVEDK